MSCLRWVACSVLLLLANTVFAQQSLQDSIDFHELLRGNLPGVWQDNINMSMIHMVPNAPLADLILQKTLDDAENLTRAQTLEENIANNRITPVMKLPTTSIPQSMTLVIVPGLFAEFLSELPFAEVFHHKSNQDQSFRDLVQRELANKNPDALDEVFDEDLLSSRSIPLSDAVTVSEIPPDWPNPVTKVVLLKNLRGSFESFGSLGESAATMNRRLEKYLRLSGDTNVVLVGYSRGALVALEMIAESSTQKSSWLNSVKALVAWGGMIWGSVIANEALNPSSVTARMLSEIKSFRGKLDPASVTTTTQAWKEFCPAMRLLAEMALKTGKYPDTIYLAEENPEAAVADPVALWKTVNRWSLFLDSSTTSANFTHDVERLQKQIDSLLVTLNDMTTTSRRNWWQTHTVPSQMTYYSMAGAMANPARGGLERTAYYGHWGYSLSSFDDQWLLQMRLNGEIANGIKLNDGQVTLAEASFLPVLSGALNAANMGMKVKHLGILNTHHWGLALPTVNRMQNGRLNPFPREILLKTLAEKILKDQEKP